LTLKELWNFKYNAPILGIEIADINGNGQEEILAHTKTGWVLILSLEGELLSKNKITENSSIWCAKVVDLNKDGDIHIILGGLDGILKVFKSTPSHSLKPLWAHQFGASIGGILSSDINNNDNQEVIAYSLDKSIRVLNQKDGNLIWGQVFEDGIGDAMIWQEEKEAKSKEVVACGNDGTLRIFNGRSGELLWHKRFSNKIRCVTRLNSAKGPIIACGGDDKLLHLIDKNAKEEVKYLEFEDYVWKSLSTPNAQYDKIITSTYSFEYFDESIQIDEIDFSSKVMCINNNLEVLWEINGINAECLSSFEKKETSFVLVGTTSGDILMVDNNKGEILHENKKDSCINMVQGLPNRNFIATCNDDGQILGYHLGD